MSGPDAGSTTDGPIDARPDDPASPTQIGLLVDHEENRRLLSEWLSREYDVATADRESPTDGRFDLYVVDPAGYARHTDTLENLTAADEQGFVPILLLSPRSTGDLDPAVWNHVDEVIATPVQRRELRTRIDGLLERRRLFVSLERRQRTIEALHDATREMVVETSPKSICATAATAATRALDLPLTGVWLIDDTGTTLEPVAQAEGSEEAFEDLPTFSANEPSLAWDAFVTGETMVFDDLPSAVGTEDLHNPDTPIRSEIVVPLGEFGVVVAGSREPRSFDEDDLQGVQLLASNTAAALGRAYREQRLAQETSRMEFFTSILRHDVLNGMTVIQSRADALAREAEDEEVRQYAETILDWSDEVVDVIERVRAVLDALTGQASMVREPIGLARVVAEEVTVLRRAYPEVTFETDVPPDLAVLADELLSEVVGNVLANAVEHNDRTDLRISVSASADGDLATMRIADTGSGIADDRKDSVFRRGVTGHAKRTGSGFGLFFVDSMVEEYGGRVWVEDNDPSGTVFVIELPTPEGVEE